MSAAPCARSDLGGLFAGPKTFASRALVDAARSFFPNSRPVSRSRLRGVIMPPQAQLKGGTCELLDSKAAPDAELCFPH